MTTYSPSKEIEARYKEEARLAALEADRFKNEVSFLFSYMRECQFNKNGELIAYGANFMCKGKVYIFMSYVYVNMLYHTFLSLPSVHVVNYVCKAHIEKLKLNLFCMYMLSLWVNVK